VGALERAACLSLQESQAGIHRSIADCVQALFRYELTITLYNEENLNFVIKTKTDPKLCLFIPLTWMAEYACIQVHLCCWVMTTCSLQVIHLQLYFWESLKTYFISLFLYVDKFFHYSGLQLLALP
jgi:hypothetical protein